MDGIQIIRDTLPMCATVDEAQAHALRNHGVPLFRGILYEGTGVRDEFGKEIFKKKKENTVVLHGAMQALEYLFGVDMRFSIPTLNEQFKVNTNIQYNKRDCTIKCFGLGTGGSPDTFGTPYDPDFKQKGIIDWIPFRVSDTDTLKAADAGQYYFRQKIADDPSPQWGWYLKEFEQIPTMKALWKDTPDPTKDGTEVVADPSGSNSPNLIECFGECLIKINKNDIRPYFEWSGNLPMARYNSIGLFSGVKKQIDSDYSDYVGVHLFSVINIDNMSVKLPTEISYLYRIYSAV